MTSYSEYPACHALMRSDMKWLNKKMPWNIPSIIGGGTEWLYDDIDTEWPLKAYPFIDLFMNSYFPSEPWKKQIIVNGIRAALMLIRTIGTASPYSKMASMSFFVFRQLSRSNGLLSRGAVEDSVNSLYQS